jgi:hypothetical protein
MNAVAQGRWSWPTAAEVGNALVVEAEGDARRLGHKLLGWVAREGRFYSRCSECLEAVVVAPRLMGVARIRGSAAHLPCTRRTEGDKPRK